MTNSPSSVIVTYRRNGGGWGTVNATLVSGTNYTFTIPGMPQGSTVQYYITATNSGGTDLKPSPTTYYSYTVGCAPPAAGTKIIAFQGFEISGNRLYRYFGAKPKCYTNGAAKLF